MTSAASPESELFVRSTDHANNALQARAFGLDLVRALAISGVLIAHFGPTALALAGRPNVVAVAAMGHGVELFFVLSGFLIGSLLIDIVERGPNLRAWLVFLLRRWMRTAPLYALWVAVCLLMWPPSNPILSIVPRYLTFTQNFAFADPSGVLGVLPVSWSLSVEEWFYLLFSALLLAIATIYPRRAALLTCAIFVVWPLAARVFFASAMVDPDSGMRQVVVYRLDAIAWGVFAILMYRYHRQAIAQWAVILLAVGATVGICACMADFEGRLEHLRPWIFSLIPIGFSLCLPALADMPSPRSVIAGAIRWLSERSYGLYIVHFTVLQHAIQADDFGVFGEMKVVLAVCLAFLLADLSYRYLELPILRIRPRQFKPVAQGGVANLQRRHDR
jgi:peptidoglycan/LPS O-acetylase OafA/YrhL